EIETVSMAACPDFLKGRGIGWPIPFSSTVRQRSEYSPAGKPGSSAAQCTLHSRIGQVPGRPSPSKPLLSFGSSLFGNLPPHCFGGASTWASTHGAVAKYLSSAGHACALG